MHKKNEEDQNTALILNKLLIILIESTGKHKGKYFFVENIDILKNANILKIDFNLLRYLDTFI